MYLRLFTITSPLIMELELIGLPFTPDLVSLALCSNIAITNSDANSFCFQ